MGHEKEVDSLRNQISTISKICSLSGSPGLSIGILHHDKVLFTKHLGRRDVGLPESPDDDTIYYTGSLLKILAGCAIARLVHDGVLEWDRPIQHYLPAFNQRKDDVGTRTTLRHLLSHQTGIAPSNFYSGQGNGETLLSKLELIRMACFLEPGRPFQYFLYSGWNYVLVLAVIESVTALRFEIAMKHMFLDPLDMKSTTFDPPDACAENIMKPHAVLNDGTACIIPATDLGSDTGMAASAGGKSSMKDLLTFFHKLLSALRYQKQNNVDITPGSPFVLLRTVFQPQVNVGNSNPKEQGYCLGIYRTELPGNLSIGSMNFPLLRRKIPAFGEKLRGIEIFHHTGTVPGFLGSIFLAPSTSMAVIALTNATPLVDASDFAAQVMFAALFRQDIPDFVPLAYKTASKSIALYQQLSCQLELSRTKVPPTALLEAYVGEYIHPSDIFILKVSIALQQLHLTVQGRETISYDLLPFDGDTFFWKADREAEVRKAMFPEPILSKHLVKFGKGLDGNINHLVWRHDSVARPAFFRKIPHLKANF